MSSIREIKDVPYCVADSGVDPLRTLDLYIPEALIDHQPERQIILVVFVHGGAWRTGDKSNHTGLARRWVSSPSASPSSSQQDAFIIVAVPNYRLSPIIKHPVHTDDIYTALQFLLSRPQLFSTTNQEDPSSFVYSSVWIAGHSVGAHIASSLVLNAPAPPSKPERDPSTLAQITGVIGIQGIYDADLLIKNFPTDFYRGFVQDAFGTRSPDDVDPQGQGTETRLPYYEDVNITKYVLPQSQTADKLLWAVVHSRDDALVDLVQAERMYTHLCHLYGGERDSEGGSLAMRVVLEDKGVRGGHDEVLESQQLAEFVHQTVFRRK